jgi:hypothetical protein
MADGRSSTTSRSTTRGDWPLVWGAHWRYHLIERFADIALAFALAGALWIVEGRPGSGDDAPDVSLIAGAMLIFAVATLVFVPTSEPFRDPAFVGHQLREFFTHGLVTVPFALGTCMVFARRFAIATPVAHPARSAWPVYAAAIVSIVAGAFLLLASLLLEARLWPEDEPRGAAVSHFFSTAWGMCWSPLAGFLYLWPPPAIDTSLDRREFRAAAIPRSQPPPGRRGYTTRRFCRRAPFPP